MVHQWGALISTLLVWAGLSWAVGTAWWLLYGRGGTARPPSVALTFGLPMALVAGGFWAGDPRYGWWLLLGTGVVMWLGVSAWSRYVTARPAPVGRAGAAALATITAGGVLTLFGVLLTLRLVVKPDPADPFVAALRTEPLLSGLGAIGVPLAGVVVAAVGLYLVRRVCARPHKTRLTRVYDRIRTVAIDDGVRFGDESGRWSRRHKGFWVGAVVVMAVLFWLPLADGGSALTFFNAATPEFAKLVFLVVMAVLVARVAFWFDINPSARRGRLFKRLRYILYPSLVFIIVLGVSAARHDFGTTVSMLAATIGVTWAATRFSMLAKPDARMGDAVTLVRRQQVRTAVAYRPFVVVGTALAVGVLALAFAVTSYAGDRGSTWTDPWRYRWDANCAVDGSTAQAGRSVPESGTAQMPQAPPGWQLCQRSDPVDDESGQSQMARALSAIADGGVFGRGLRDTASSYVPAASTDFILVVVWQKLGAGAVILTAALTILLGLALPRAVRWRDPRPGAGPTPAELFAAGLGAMVVGQFLFVFAASVNLLPHSGLPAPLLSRGGQSNLAVLLGVLAVLAAGLSLSAGVDPVHMRRTPVPAPAPRPGLWSRLRELPAGQFGLFGALLFCLAVVSVVTLVPYWAMFPRDGSPLAVYGNDRPMCTARGADRESLSTPPPDPRLCSTDRLAYDRTRVEIRFGAVSGLVQRRPGGTWTVLSGSGLRADDLAGLLRHGWGGAGALDRSHTDVLAGTAGTTLQHRVVLPGRDRSADGWLSLTLDPALQHAVADALRASGSGRGGAVVIEVTSGRVLAAVTTPAAPDVPHPTAPSQADRDAVDAFERRHPECIPGTGGCWRWSIRRETAVPRTAAGHNRAFGSRYPLDGVAPVVVAAAHLGRPGAGIDAPIAGAPGCTVRAMLRSSCRGAATALARSTGWPAVESTARGLGLGAGDCATEDARLTVPLHGSAATCVTGTGVTGNPLGLATLMAAVANDGVAMRPGLVAGHRTPGTRQVHTVPAPDPTRALEPAAAIALDDALRTTVEGREVRLVTGGPAGHRWAAGYLLTGKGTVAFASVIEGDSDVHPLLDAIHRTLER